MVLNTRYRTDTPIQLTQITATGLTDAATRLSASLDSPFAHFAFTEFTFTGFVFASMSLACSAVPIVVFRIEG